MLSLKVDNSKLPNSRWYSGGGIYRPVTLFVYNKDHIAFQGVKVSTVSINPAVVNVKVDATGGEANIEILKNGKVVGTGAGL